MLRNTNPIKSQPCFLKARHSRAFKKQGWDFIGFSVLRSTYEIKPGIFDEKRGNAALLIKNSGFYLIFN